MKTTWTFKYKTKLLHATFPTIYYAASYIELKSFRERTLTPSLPPKFQVKTESIKIESRTRNTDGLQ